ncbi:MAG: Ig-like domain-containing protein, partial [Gemmatimonadota bacterium]
MRSASQPRPRQLNRWTALGLLAAVCVLARCADAVAPGVEPAFIKLIAGTGQSGVVGRTLEDMLLVRVTDADGIGVPGVVVTWTAASGNVSPLGSATDEEGNVSAAWTLGTQAGDQHSAASAEGLGTVAFVADGAPDIATSVTVSSDAVVFTSVGDSARLLASAADIYGNPLTSPSIIWTSSASAVVTVDDAGVVRSVADGTAMITASVDTARTSVMASVRRIAATLTVDPGAALVTALGDEVELAARVRDANGHDLPDTTSVSWQTLMPAVAAVDEDGRIVARGNGTATIIASAAGLTAGAEITVRQEPASIVVSPGLPVLGAVGDTLRLTATVRDRRGHAIADAAVNWTSSASGIAAVDATGLLRGMSPGSASVTASAGAVDAVVTVTVPEPPNAPPVAVITAPASDMTFAAGEPVTFEGSASDPEDGDLSGSQLQWSSDLAGSIGSGASFTRADLATGTHTITFTATDGDGAQGTATVMVHIAVPEPPVPATLSMVVGDGQSAAAGTLLPLPLVVRVLDGADAPLPGVTVTWAASGDGSLDVITSVTGAEGTTSAEWTLGAEAGVQTASASVTDLEPVTFTATAVSEAPVAAEIVALEGDGQSAATGTLLPLPLVVRVLDGAGAPLPGVTVTWAASGDGSLDVITSVTGAEGTTSAEWTLGAEAGVQSASAIVTDLEPVIFTATALGNESRWVAAGAGGASLATSEDGITWAAVTAPGDYTRGFGVAYDGAQWVAVGGGTVGGESGAIATSPDGITWTARPHPFDGEVYAAAWNGSLWVAAAYGTNEIATSSDGQTWTAQEPSLTNAARGVAWNGVVWVAVVGDGDVHIITSPDGVSWTERSSPFTVGAYGVAWNGAYFTAAGEGGVQIATSPDGIVWTGRAAPFAGSARSIAWNGVRWAAGGCCNGTISTSSDGVTWTLGNSPFSVAVNALAWNGAMWVAAGEGDAQLATSSDGVNWTARTSPFTTRGSGVAWSTPLFPLAVNQAPVATVAEPAAGVTVTAGTAIEFSGSALDAEDGALGGAALVWTSDLDGEIGTGTGFTRGDLSEGTHAITLRATDSDGAVTAAGISVTITAAPPPSSQVVWLGGAAAGPTSWFVAGNWSTGVVPTETDSVAIPVVTSAPVLTGSAAARAVHVTGTLTLAGAQLDADVLNGGLMEIAGGNGSRI